MTVGSCLWDPKPNILRYRLVLWGERRYNGPMNRTLFQVVLTPWIPSEGDVRFTGTYGDCLEHASRMNTPYAEALGHVARVVKVETIQKDGGTLRSITPC